jgi:hypothetical protein
MRARITLSLAAIALGAASITAPAFAATKQTTPTYSNIGPNSGAPLSPGGIGAGANAFGGPGAGYIAPVHPPAKLEPVKYSNVGPNNGAPLSPGGIGAGANAFGGPSDGYIGPHGAKGTPAAYPNIGPRGTPLSPGGIGAGASAFGGPGFQ